MVAIPKCIAKVIDPKYYNQFGKRLRKNLWAVGCAIRLFGAFAQIHKGQLISKCPLGVIVSTKKPTNFFKNFGPSL